MAKNVLQGSLPELSSDGDFYVSSDLEVILQSIWTILVTRPNDRVWNPEFGCGIMDYLYDINDQKTRTKIETTTKEALERWEPRIKVTEVSCVSLNTYSISLTIKFTFNRKDYTYSYNISEEMSDMSVYDLKVN